MSVTTVNTRNQFRGTVVAIHKGDVMSEVEIETSMGIISSVITTRSIASLGLKVGDSALALFKAVDVLVAKLD
jgi:molybdopterin-binding protein